MKCVHIAPIGFVRLFLAPASSDRGESAPEMNYKYLLDLFCVADGNELDKGAGGWSGSDGLRTKKILQFSDPKTWFSIPQQ